MVNNKLPCRIFLFKPDFGVSFFKRVVAILISGHLFDNFCKGPDAVFDLFTPGKPATDTDTIMILPGGGAHGSGQDVDPSLHGCVK